VKKWQTLLKNLFLEADFIANERRIGRLEEEFHIKLWQ